MKNIIILIVAIFIFGSCSTSKNAAKIAEITNKVEKLAKSNFKSDYTIKYNKSYDYAAVYKKLESKTNKNFPYLLKTMLFDIKNNKVIWGNTSGKGSLEWISKTKLQIKHLTKELKKSTLIYDTKTKSVSYIQ